MLKTQITTNACNIAIDIISDAVRACARGHVEMATEESQRLWTGPVPAAEAERNKWNISV